MERIGIEPMTSWLQSTHGQHHSPTTCWVFPLKTPQMLDFPVRECWPFVAFHATPTLHGETQGLFVVNGSLGFRRRLTLDQRDYVNRRQQHWAVSRSRGDVGNQLTNKRKHERRAVVARKLLEVDVRRVFRWLEPASHRQFEFEF